MISREYNKRISVYEVVLTRNEFGGSVPTDTLMFSSWAKLETSGVGYKATDFGLTTFENPVLFRVRFRNDFKYQGRTLYLMYRNEKYIIKGVRNKSEANIELDIFATKAFEVIA